ncbi:MAG: SMC-Scp complex subunit ScpB [Clostridiales bacterium]|nr:SMC-Scp complex subunit ScpB [Clostridiales bacterium]
MAEDFKITLQELPGAIEAILFVSGDPVNAEKIADILDCSKADVVKTLNDLMNRYEQNPWSGLTIVRAEDSYVMMTKPSEKKVLERLFGPRTQAPLSQASYETLAVIAYNQPCTRAQVEQVRGVSSDSIISRLLDRGWIEEAGNLDAPGRPALFKTSKQFLTEFGIESVKDLPPMELMSYKTIRDLEDSLRKAAGGEDKQLTIDSLLENKEEKSDEAEETTDGDN